MNPTRCSSIGSIPRKPSIPTWQIRDVRSRPPNAIASSPGRSCSRSAFFRASEILREVLLCEEDQRLEQRSAQHAAEDDSADTLL